MTTLTIQAARLLRVVLLACLTMLAACATAPDKKAEAHPDDPYEGFNRAMYRFNDAVDRAVLKPVSKGYQAVTPEPVQAGISNFFTNLAGPIVIVNDLLQAKFLQALADTGRFVVNTTVGIGGLFDPASKLGLEAHNEDFGQTLGAWGVPSGPYLVLPFLGPSTIRDTAGLYPDYHADPLSYYDNDPERYQLWALRLIDLRAGLLELDPQIQESFDPYAFIRDAYLQRRKFLVYDGNPPVDYPDYLLEDDWEDDEPQAPPAEEPTSEVEESRAAQDDEDVPSLD